MSRYYKKKKKAKKANTKHATRPLRIDNDASQKIPNAYLKAKPTHIEHTRLYENRRYYKVHFDDKGLTPLYLLRNNGIDLDPLIKKFSKNNKLSQTEHFDDMEWEVQSIEGSRLVDGKYEYLVKWKHWIGEPTWLREDDCDCLSLIAAHDNPRLKSLLNFKQNNKNLWICEARMHTFIKKTVKRSLMKANVLDTMDTSCSTWPENIEDGLNIGCTMFDHHWYMVFIIKNFLCVTQAIFISDSLNTMLADKIDKHPIYIRIKQVFPRYSIRPMKMTAMDRSDMCAFYTLAAIERALFLMNPRAKFIPEFIGFHPVRAEYIRSQYAPETDTQMTLTLPTKQPTFTCPVCEFCRQEFDDFKNLDNHIERHHFSSRTQNKCVKKEGGDINKTNRKRTL